VYFEGGSILSNISSCWSTNKEKKRYEFQREKDVLKREKNIFLKKELEKLQRNIDQ